MHARTHGMKPCYSSWGIEPCALKPAGGGPEVLTHSHLPDLIEAQNGTAGSELHTFNVSNQCHSTASITQHQAT